jgi:hypothetical protein
MEKMPIGHDFEAPFGVEIYERELWNYVATEHSILTYYTDASKKDWMTGMGIDGPSVRYYEALGALTTIFQAGMYAPESALIQKAWQASLCTYIMSDSQATLRALISYTFTSS